ncbi:MAG: hypothetical protein ACREHD_14740, partial [Pirellulales bacterium]
MNRRDALKSLAAISLASGTTRGDEPDRRQPLGLVIHSYAVRGSRPLEPGFPPIADPLAFVECAAGLGAAGAQTRIGARPAGEIDQLRKTVESRGMYLEGIVGLPKDEGDVTRFEAEIAAAKMAGADVVRTVCLSGRRYEEFHS